MSEVDHLLPSVFVCNTAFSFSRGVLFFAVVPLMVEIVNKVDQLVVGRESEIVCRSTGSRPPAHITWYLGGQRLEGGDSTESVSIRRGAT